MADYVQLLLRDDDVVLAAALAFTFELSEPEMDKNASVPEEKPTSYFTHEETIHDIDELYHPQCDQMQTDIDSEDVIIVQENIVRSNSVEETDIPQVISIASEYRTARKPSKPHQTSPSMKRYSSRQLFQRLALEEKNRDKRKAPITKVARKKEQESKRKRFSEKTTTENKGKKKTSKNKTSERNICKNKTIKTKQCTKNSTKESYQNRKKREQESRSEADKARKARSIIARATRATVRAFGFVASVESKAGAANLFAWRSWHVTTVQLLRELTTNPQSTHRKSQFHVYLVNSVSVLEKTMTSARSRPEETHQLMLQFIVGFNKIWDAAVKLGVKQLTGGIGRLLQTVIGWFLAYPKRMNPTNLSWVQTKEVLELFLSVLTQVELVNDVLILLNRIQYNFLIKWTHRTDDHMIFKSYAVSQLASFFSIISRRLAHLTQQRQYNFSI